MSTVSVWLVVMAVVAIMLTAFIMVTGAFFARDGMKPSIAVAAIGAAGAVLSVVDDQGWITVALFVFVLAIGSLLTLICSGGER